MSDLSRARDTLYTIFRRSELKNKEDTSMYLGVCSLGIKETPDRIGFYRKVIRSIFFDFVCQNHRDEWNKISMTREDLENIIDFFTEKPTAAALVINCDEKIIKFLEPTEEDIADSKPNYICTLNENYKH